MAPKVAGAAERAAILAAFGGGEPPKPRGPSETELLGRRLMELVEWLRAGNAQESVLMLPLPPNMGNADFGHWRTRYDVKRQYAEYFKTLLNLNIIMAPPEKPPLFSSLEIKMFVRAELDQDNAHARIKFALDGLTKNGYIVDDKKKYLKYVLEQVIDRKSPTRLEIRWLENVEKE